jgi:hypothetical protein
MYKESWYYISIERTRQSGYKISGYKIIIIVPYEIAVVDNMNHEADTIGTMDVSKPIKTESADTSPEMDPLAEEAGACGGTSGVSGQTTVADVLGALSNDPVSG